LTLDVKPVLGSDVVADLALQVPVPLAVKLVIGCLPDLLRDAERRQSQMFGRLVQIPRPDVGMQERVVVAVDAVVHSIAARGPLDRVAEPCHILEEMNAMPVVEFVELAHERISKQQGIALQILPVTMTAKPLLMRAIILGSSPFTRRTSLSVGVISVEGCGHVCGAPLLDGLLMPAPGDPLFERGFILCTVQRQLDRLPGPGRIEHGVGKFNGMKALLARSEKGSFV